MSRCFIIFSILLFYFSTSHSQKKLEWSIGGGMTINHHDHDEFDTWDGTYLGKSKFNSYSYGFNGFVTYFPKKYYGLRTGLIHQHTRFDHIWNVNIMNSFAIPLYFGLHWKYVKMFSGLEAEYSIFSFIYSGSNSIPFDNVLFLPKKGYYNLRTFSLNIPLQFEMDLSSHLAIGLRHKLFKNLKIHSKDNTDKLNVTYLYLNVKF